ncbi:hypothetical protein A5647_20575 [Mycobacterium sp. 1100029.7]|nr:hypothetical protein A5647_20575 [Mycobacterium sp. 1100029.7]
MGIVFGILALSKIKETGQNGRGLAIAGIAIGGFLLVLATLGGILNAVGEFEHHDSGAPVGASLSVTSAEIPAMVA